MKNKNIIYLAIAGAVLYYMLKKKKAYSIQVPEPDILTKKEFESYGQTIIPQPIVQEQVQPVAVQPVLPVQPVQYIAPKQLMTKSTFLSPSVQPTIQPVTTYGQAVTYQVNENAPVQVVQRPVAVQGIGYFPDFI